MILQTILIGIGVSMDAFAVSICNGLILKRSDLKLISASIFAAFHFLMPLAGFLVGGIFKDFVIEYAPWLAFLFFCFIGGRILFDKLRKKDECNGIINLKIFIFQAIITSIDSLLAGIALVALEYSQFQALISCAAISAITFFFCFFGCFFGGKLNSVLGKRAENFGSIILILVGVRAFLSRFF
ncbi:MAG: manganese efflux pump [Oscillospiraceae bacterium]|nr:manganese efflux pump [Oscillospiraceae bacterium]